MAFTEFYCESGGSNLNAGSNTGAVTLSFTSGNWVQATRVFTAAGADLSGVSAGMFASVYADGASAPTGYIARITAVDDGADTITLSATVLVGTAPTDGTGNRTIKVGGAWLGPTGASGFPFGVISNVLVNTSGDPVRVNMKNDATYSISTGITHTTNGVRFEGYTSSVGDGGRATIDGSTNAIILCTISGDLNALKNLIFQNNGTTGSNSGLAVSGTGNLVTGVVVNTVRGGGINVTGGADNIVMESEVYGANTSNTANLGGIGTTGTGVAHFIRNICHDMGGTTNGNGFFMGTGAGRRAFFLYNIADSNPGRGFLFNIRAAAVVATGNEAYNNTDDGIDIIETTSAGRVVLENNNLIKNGGYGITLAATLGSVVILLNNGFGAGTQANTSGETNGLNSSLVTGSVTYPSNSTPWVDPANGDFRINLAQAINAGRGSYTQTASSYAGAVGYPDIGSAQHLESASGGGLLRHPGMAGGLNA